MIRPVVLGCLVFIASLTFPDNLLATSYTVDIFAQVPGCGDSLIQTGESCDGSNLGGATCESVGFDEGSLSCSSVCTLITASCVIDNNPSSGGGGGRNTPGPNELVVTDTNVVVGGLALPGMSVSLLKDGQRVATVPAKEDGTFQMTVTGLATGVYRMQIVGTLGLTQSVRSDVFVVRVIKNSTTKISGIVLPPTLSVTKDVANLLVTGFTFPGTPVQLIVNGAETALAVSDETGLYKFVFPKQTNLVETTIAVSTVHGGISVSSTLTLSTAPSALPPSVACKASVDINVDCSVDVVDFFVMRWRFLTDVFAKQFDFNSDGSVTIVDFSIMAFYWTG